MCKPNLINMWKYLWCLDIRLALKYAYINLQLPAESLVFADLININLLNFDCLRNLYRLASR